MSDLLTVGPEEFERLQRATLELSGILLTAASVPHLIAVPQSMRLRFGELLAEKASSLRCVESRLLHVLAPELLELLSSETLGRLQKEISLSLQSLLLGLRPHDVRSEVLIQWMSQWSTSSSSSVLADGESGDSVAADPRNDGSADTSWKGVNGDA